MSAQYENQDQQDQLSKLVRWCDELGELRALESFLGEAISQIAAGGGFLEVNDCTHGVHLFCRELNRRTEALRLDIYSECVRLRN